MWKTISPSFMPADLHPGVRLRDEESSIFRHPMVDGEWHALISRIRSRLERPELQKIRIIAASIEEGINRLDPVMGGYCELTCPSCQDPCCNGRRIFFNRTDMLQLVASGGEVPPGQTRAREMGSCRYLEKSGCILPRSKRPYVCVWFLCEPQMALFQSEPAAFQRKFIKVLQDIRESRLLLESLYEHIFPD